MKALYIINISMLEVYYISPGFETTAKTVVFYLLTGWASEAS